jgi:raffinose/stachyose/melibiose transport system substrate-binding protein
VKRPTQRAIALAAISCALLLGACGSDGNEGAAEGGDGGKPTGTIKVVALNLGEPGDKNPMRVAARKFEEATPGAKVEVALYEFDQFDKVVRAQINGGSPPDVVQTVLGYGNATALKTLAMANALTDLSDQPWVDQIPEEAKDASGLDGKVYAYPPMYGLIGAFYDAKLFDELGVEPPATYEEVLSYCETMAGKGKTPISLGAQTPIAATFLADALVASTGFIDDPDLNQKRLNGETTFAGSEGWRQALEQYDEMNQAGCFGESPTGVAYQASVDNAATGKAGMILLTIEGLPALQTANPDGDFRLVAFPGNDDPAETMIPAAPSAGFAVARKAENPELAKEFVTFLSGSEISTEYALGVGSVPLAGIGSKETAQFPPGTEAMAPYIAEGRSVIYMSQYWPAPEVAAAYESGITGMLSGQTEPVEVLEAMDKAWKAP